MKKGNINVSVENIFPLIKKFLYSDHEIFLRELISNATDATLKLKHIAGIGKEKIEVGEPTIEVKIDKKGKNTKISVKGRHDPCVGIRAVPIGEAMINCVLLDHLLMHRAQCG